MLEMLRASLLLAVAATCIVRPWFWISLLKRNIWKIDGKKIGFTKEDDRWKRELDIELRCFIGSFLFNIFMYAILLFSVTIWGSLIQVALCCGLQMLWQNQKQQRYVFAVIIVICLISVFFDGTALENTHDKFDEVLRADLPAITSTADGDEGISIIRLFSNDEIKSLFQVSDVDEGPLYNNSKFIYVVSGGYHEYGVVVVDKNDYTKAILVPCKTNGDYRYVRMRHPTARLATSHYVISDDNVPYSLHGLGEKDGLFGKYSVREYIMVNLVTGEDVTLTEDELPDFVTR